MQWETATPVGFPVCMRHHDCRLKRPLAWRPIAYCTHQFGWTGPQQSGHTSVTRVTRERTCVQHSMHSIEVRHVQCDSRRWFQCDPTPNATQPHHPVQGGSHPPPRRPFPPAVLSCALVVVGPTRSGMGPPLLLQPRLPSHGLHCNLSSKQLWWWWCVRGGGGGCQLSEAPTVPPRKKKSLPGALPLY